jgi:hypothetical protein
VICNAKNADKGTIQKGRSINGIRVDCAHRSAQPSRKGCF